MRLLRYVLQDILLFFLILAAAAVMYVPAALLMLYVFNYSKRMLMVFVWKPHIQIAYISYNQFSNFPFGLNSILLDQVLDRLVSSSSKCYHSFTDDLSPGSLPGVLLLSNGTLILEVGFTLRCLQRLSRPHFASLLCRWHDNSCTSDASTPVLSY